MNLRFKPEARDDLLAIARFIGEDNPARAASFMDELLDHCARIAARPKAHRLRAEWGEHIRAAPFGSYQVIYVIDDKGIDILRVLHGRMNISAILGEPQ